MDRLKLRKAVALQLDVQLRTGPGLSLANKIVVSIVLLSILGIILETEPLIYESNKALFLWFEWAMLILLVIEFSLRLWSCLENPRYTSRWRYCLKPVSLIDLFVIASMAFTAIGLEGGLLRLLRLVRILRLAKLGKYSEAIHNLSEAITSRRFELVVSLAVALGLLLLSSSALYVIEGELQPEVFGSIPRAMWWAVATLTTVGYGDVVPMTALGRIFAALTAITGIGLIALPAGILAAAFSDAMQKRRRKETEGD